MANELTDAAADRFRSMQLASNETTMILDYLSGYSPEGVMYALDFIEKYRRRTAERRSRHA